MLPEGLYNLLTNAAPITALLGTPLTRSDKTSGCFPMQAPDEPTLPYLITGQLTGENEQSFDGPNRFMSVRYRISSWSSTARNAKLLANTTKLFLNGFRGTLSDGTVVQSVIDISEADATEELAHGVVFGTHNDYQILLADHSDGR
jgi:hypothetical protein